MIKEDINKLLDAGFSVVERRIMDNGMHHVIITPDKREWVDTIPDGYKTASALYEREIEFVNNSKVIQI